MTYVMDWAITEIKVSEIRNYRVTFITRILYLDTFLPFGIVTCD